MKILSGARPTGKLHLGNYFGAIKRWVELQEAGEECFFSVVDWHSLTTDYADTSKLQENIKDMLIDWLACGVDPKKSVIFLQSAVKEHAELYLLLSMITPLGWLTRVPTYKEQQLEMKEKDLNTFGFLGYPVLQAADIMLYKAQGVPVGEDQLPHLELTREIIRRLNTFYKTKLPEPASLLTPTPRISGTDGRKMSKSYNNAIYLSDSPEAISKAVMSMVTDTQRVRRTDPGEPDRCNLYPLHRLVSTDATCTQVAEGCRAATLGCVDDKKLLIPNLVKFLQPIQERRQAIEREIAKDGNYLYKILEDGNKRARAVAAATLAEIRQAMNLR